MKIGVISDCFKLPLADSIQLAGEMGFDGIQIYATTGEFSPAVLTSARKAEIRTLLQENRLTISALCGDMGGYGFQIAGDNPERIEKTERIIDLAAEFGVPVVTTHIGVIPADKVESVLLGFDFVTPNYQITVSREGALDSVRIDVEMAPGVAFDTVREVEQHARTLRGAIEQVLNIAATVRLVPPGTLERSEGKAKRVIDTRNLLD